MKRIQSACLHQTVHFQLKDDIAHQLAVDEVKAEYENYKQQLDRRHIQHKILEEKTLDDGSIVIRIIKQFNSYDAGNYLD